MVPVVLVASSARCFDACCFVGVCYIDASTKQPGNLLGEQFVPKPAHTGLLGPKPTSNQANLHLRQIPLNYKATLHYLKH